MHLKHLLLIAILALTAACSSSKLDENLSETELYQQAMDDMEADSYTNAIIKLKALESRYPFGQYAEQSQLELIYAYYRNNESEAARSSADRFIRLNPQSANVDYAYYLKGLAAYDQDSGLLSRFLPLDMSKRDPGAARDSFNDFAQLTSRFPNSRYAPDARQRMIYLRNLLADYEIHVGDYYLRRKAYVAAANRGRYVVENFQGTPAVGNGLGVMVEAYQNLQMDDLATTSLDVLKYNYPDNRSLVDGQFVPRETAYKYRSWVSRKILDLIESDNPLPAGETRASRDVIRQYEDAQEEIPDELQPENQEEFRQHVMEANEDLEMEHENIKWYDFLTFGWFGGTDEVEAVTNDDPEFDNDVNTETELDEETED